MRLAQTFDVCLLMLPGKSYTPDDVVAMLLRRRWLIVLPFLGCAFAAAVVAWVLPSVWRSTAIISIVPQRIPESYVRATVTLGPQDRVEAIRRDILSRPKLERIVRDYGLYGVGAGSEGMDEVVARMRNDIKMDETKGDAFEVSYSSGDPVLSQRVASRLADLFIEENIRQRTQLAAGSSEFLKSQLDQVKAQLVATENRLEAYRRSHEGELPSQVTANLQAITNAQMQLQQVRESVNRDRDRRLILERQIADLEQPVPEPVSATDASGVAVGGTAAARLQQAVAVLAALEGRLKPIHPDVVRAKAVVADLTIKAREEAAAQQAEGSTAASGISPAEILRRRKIRDLRAELASIDTGLQAKAVEEQRLLAQAGEYQARVNAAPARESELTSLLRDYETVSTQYRLLLTNSKSAEMAQDLERRQGGEQFRLLESARVPERPTSPKRPLILAGGAAFGLVIGLGLVGFLEFQDRTLRAKGDVTALLGLPVLAAVPVMTSKLDHRQQLRQSLALWSVAIVLFAGAAVASWGALHR
jgi:polysaccharide chain length determinant protein (PEP-CTERM system associated)